MDHVEAIKLLLQVLGLVAPVALALLARKHAALSAVLQDVLDAVESVGHKETQAAVEEAKK